MRCLTSLVLVLAITSGCLTDNRPASCADLDVSIALTVSSDGMTPSDPGVCRDQRVTLVIEAGTSGQFHIHGYDDVLPITEIRAGEEARVEFVAARSGQFPVELHPADDPAGIGIGVFTVYEP
jgi:hypothetical protein